MSFARRIAVLPAGMFIAVCLLLAVTLVVVVLPFALAVRCLEDV